MGHLLATVNPEAAAAIKPESSALPNVGHIVKFYPRPGEYGGGRTDFAMYVTDVSNDGLVKGVVIMDADDFRNQERLRRRSVDHQWPAWDFIEAPGETSREFVLDMMELQDKTVDNMEKRIADLEARLEALEDKSA